MNQETQPQEQTQNVPMKKAWYKKWWVITIAVFLVLSAIIGSSEEGKDKTQETSKPAEQMTVQSQENEVTNEKSEQTDRPQVSDVQPEIKLPKYEIAYQVEGKRYDGGINYYVLIDPVDLTNDSFKNDIKNITRQIVKDKGLKISVDFVDNKNVLDLEYKSHYGSNTLGRILTKAEMDELGQHLVAVFSGELEIDEPKNSLLFFPSASRDTLRVGKYVDHMEFNP